MAYEQGELQETEISHQGSTSDINQQMKAEQELTVSAGLL